MGKRQGDYTSAEKSFSPRDVAGMTLF